MLRTLRYLFLGTLALVLIALALANRDTVTLRLLPAEAGAFLGFGWSIDLPLFLVIFGGILLGLFVGFVWEWLREHRIRAEAAQSARKLGQLEREVSRLSAKTEGPKDEVLALLEDPRRAR